MLSLDQRRKYEFTVHLRLKIIRGGERERERERERQRERAREREREYKEGEGMR